MTLMRPQIAIFYRRTGARPGRAEECDEADKERAVDWD